MFVVFNVVGCIAFGLLLALLLAGGAAFLSYACFAPFRSRIAAGAVIAVSFLLLLYQSVTFVGGWYARDYVSGWLKVGNHTVETLRNDTSLSLLAETLGVDAQTAAGVNDGISSAQSLANSLLDMVDDYLWARVGWTAVILLLTVVSFALMQGKSGGRRGSARGNRISRNSVSRHRSRPSRRRR